MISKISSNEQWVHRKIHKAHPNLCSYCFQMAQIKMLNVFFAQCFATIRNAPAFFGDDEKKVSHTCEPLANLKHLRRKIYQYCQCFVES